RPRAQDGRAPGQGHLVGAGRQAGLTAKAAQRPRSVRRSEADRTAEAAAITQAVEFRPVSQRASWAVIALVAVAILDVVAVWADWARYDLLGRIVNGEGYTIAEATTSDNRQSAIALLQIGGLIFGAVFFIRWFLDA